MLKKTADLVTEGIPYDDDNRDAIDTGRRELSNQETVWGPLELVSISGSKASFQFHIHIYSY